MKKSYSEVVHFLESLQIMPKTMPGLEKIKKAFVQTSWYSKIDPMKVIVVAGTNGKGSTCATLEALLIEAKKKVGFYSSPHLVSTTERIRLNANEISEDHFVALFQSCKKIIQECELSHFEALTFMAGAYFFSETWNLNLDYIILEVGLGGSFDATNAFPHQYSVITPIDFDHMNILGYTLPEIARNKFGIVSNNNQVVFQKLAPELLSLKIEIQKKTNSTWTEVQAASFHLVQTSSEPKYMIDTQWGSTQMLLIGERAAQNTMTALTVFEKLGFDPSHYLSALKNVSWPGRMQKINWPGCSAAVYLSGDHNQQGIQSLIRILKDFNWNHIFIVIGIGQDKDADEMLNEIIKLNNLKLYLTKTPFKGRNLDQYPRKYLDLAVAKNENPIELLNLVASKAQLTDLVLVTGSLYLVGEVLKHIKYKS